MLSCCLRWTTFVDVAKYRRYYLSSHCNDSPKHVSALQATNAKLADEKQRMDVLLARQYNLISCVLAQDAGKGDGKNGTLQEKTLGRWSGLRRVKAVEGEKRGEVEGWKSFWGEEGGWWDR